MKISIFFRDILQTECLCCNTLSYDCNLQSVLYITIHRFRFNFKWYSAKPTQDCFHLHFCSYCIYFLNFSGSLCFCPDASIWEIVWVRLTLSFQQYFPPLFKQRPYGLTKARRACCSRAVRVSGTLQSLLCLQLPCHPVFGLQGPWCMAKTPKPVFNIKAAVSRENGKLACFVLRPGDNVLRRANTIQLPPLQGDTDTASAAPLHFSFFPFFTLLLC